MAAEQTLTQLVDWKEFYGLEGAAAATLMGLLFVAVALNADLILAKDRPQTKLRAEQAFQNYVAVLMISQIMLFPKLPNDILSMFLLLEASLMILYAAFRLFKSARNPEIGFGRAHHTRRLIPSFFAYGLIVSGAYNLLNHFEPAALFRVAFGTLLLLVTATVTSWELLIRVAEIRHSLVKPHA